MANPHEEYYSTISDLKELRLRRGTKRGLITRIEHFFTVQDKAHLKHLSMSELTKKAKSLEQVIQELEVIQCRIEQVATGEELEAEAAEVVAVYDKHNDLASKMEALIQVATVWKTGNRMSYEIEDILEVPSLKVSPHRETYEKLKSDYVQLREAAATHLERKELVELKESVAPLMSSLQRKAKIDFKEPDPSPSSAPPSSSSTASHSAPPPRSSRLKLELPKFSGDMLDWREFWHIFSARLDRETDLEDFERINCLEAAMEDPEAKAVVRTHGYGGVYADVVKALQATYDRHKLVYKHHVKQVQSLPSITDDHDGYVKFRRLMTKHLAGIRACKGDSFEQLVTALFEALLPSTVLAMWSQYTAKEERPPTLKSFADFIDQRIADTEMLPPTGKSPPAADRRPTTSHSSKNKNKHQSRSLHLKDAKPDVCPVCDGSHTIYQCPTFKEWTPERRYGLARRKHLCFNCLGNNHSVENCSSRRTCKECKQKHHSYLHRFPTNEQPSETQESSSVDFNGMLFSTSVLSNDSIVDFDSTFGSSPIGEEEMVAAALHIQTETGEPELNTSLFPATALVTVSAGPLCKKARILMDSGSVITLVTARLAKTLNAPRLKSRKVILGMQNSTVGRSTYAVRLTLEERSGDPSKAVIVFAHVVDSIADIESQDLSSLRSQPFLQGKPLADPELGKFGTIDILLSVGDCNRCTYNSSVSSPDRATRSWHTIFGWVVGGYSDNLSASTNCLKLTSADDSADQILQRFWEQEEVPDSTSFYNKDEAYALKQFHDTTVRDGNGRYIVQLPRKDPPIPLGSSRQTAIRRYEQNKRSLQRRGQWEAFHQGLDEYRLMGHAELVPEFELKTPIYDVFYLPTHGVVKESSSTTKLRIVFDGSMKTSNNQSLNDLLHAGPSLYPKLTTVLNQFRLHTIGMSADISKMFREVGLAECDKDLHRFLHEDEDGNLQDWRMRRLTFGITSSPFLASRVLLQVAEDHAQQFPKAAAVIKQAFYVDDCLTGAQTLEEADQLRRDLNSILELGCFTLRKWRSSSPELLERIPAELKEKENSNLSLSPSQCPKTLGIHWNTSTDLLYVSIPDVSSLQIPTKREVASALGKVFDVLGWYSPSTVLIKALLQLTWKEKLGWDEPLPSSMLATWSQWKDDLSSLSSHPVPRRLTSSDSPVIELQLHGFSDSSMTAYGCVVYLRALHQDTSVSVSIVGSKSKVAPLTGITIPRLELCGALLLSRLLSCVSQDLDIPNTHVCAWCDSSAVLGWIKMAPTRLKSFVANRVQKLTNLVPPEQWHYVSSSSNPADHVSRGLLPRRLLDCDLWWQGPPWLKLPPEEWPLRQDLDQSVDLPELKATVLAIQPPPPTMDLWSRYSSFTRLLTITAWCSRFGTNCRKMELKNSCLTSQELQKARTLLLHLSQKLSYPKELDHLQKGQPVSKSSPLFSLCPLLGDDGLMRVGGRIEKSDQSYNVNHPVILHKHSRITKLLAQQVHLDASHVGPHTMLAILSEDFCIVGAKSLLRQISKNCVVCQKAYARSATQRMGLLPTERVKPSPPFAVTGIDYAGPFLIRQGHTRKPVLIKSYACLFICFTTRAVHIELVSELTSQAFLEALNRFTDRRGYPSTIITDNGTNFVGARRELHDLKDLLVSKSTEDKLQTFTASHNIVWKFSPSRSPHFGGLWESGIKNMKMVLRKLVGPHHLTFEQLYSVLTAAEATLNSRPLLPLDSTSPEGVTALTPGHFITGRPLLSLPSKVDTKVKITLQKRWDLTNRLRADLWTRWYAIYLQTLQRREKWQTQKLNFKPNDIVLLKETNPNHRHWPLARILETYLGSDGCVRVVKLLCDGREYKRAIHKLVPLVSVDDANSSPPGSVSRPRCLE